MPYGNIIRNLNNNEGNMSGVLTIQPTAGSGVSDVLVNGASVVSDHKAYINIDVDQTVTEGQKIASIEINGQSTDILIPELNVYDESTGDLITIDDAAAAPVKALSVTLEPVQDLHGYDSPWVGGAGKNKLPTFEGNPQTINGVTFTPQKDGSVICNGTASSLATFQGTVGTFVWDGNSDYWLSGCPIGGSKTTFSLRINSDDSYSEPDNGSGVKLQSARGDIANNKLFYVIIIRSGYTCNNLLFKPMLNAGLSAETYEPYSNICPISGWDEVKVNVSPTQDAEDGTTYTINLGGTYYGGNLDAVQGKLIPYKYYPSYNGEALVGPWISSMDAYTPHGTPTTGAQVVDFGAFESEVTLTPTQIDLLRGINNVWSDGEVYVKWKVDIEMMLQSIIDSMHI